MFKIQFTEAAETAASVSIASQNFDPIVSLSVKQLVAVDKFRKATFYAVMNQRERNALVLFTVAKQLI